MGEQDLYEESRDQKASAGVVGCGCLLAVLAALFLAAALATAITIDRAFDREVAAYSICEACGLVLDAANVHAACAGEAAHE